MNSESADGWHDRFDPWPSAVDIHIAWEVSGARLAAERGDLVVIVDVLSFSTAVTSVVAGGATALSYSEAEIAQHGGRLSLCVEADAQIVAKERAPTDGSYSLSPANLGSIEPGERLIFTSANGAACTSAAALAPAVAIGCLNNRSAVALWVDGQLGSAGSGRCTVVACGERWSSSIGERGADTWRPGLEDHIGVGAIAAALGGLGRSLSVEATAAAASYGVMAGDVETTLAETVSGRELVARGHREDVVLAARVDSCGAVPVWDPGRGAVREFRDGTEPA